VVRRDAFFPAPEPRLDAPRLELLQHVLHVCPVPPSRRRLARACRLRNGGRCRQIVDECDSNPSIAMHPSL
jgi:hypothetical protein